MTVALVRNLAALVPFMYPIWVGYGAGSRAPFSFYFMSILAILLAALLFTAVTAIFAMIVMRNVPTQKMRQVIMIGSLVVGFMFVLATQVLSAKMTRSNGLDATALAQAAQGWGDWAGHGICHMSGWLKRPFSLRRDLDFHSGNRFFLWLLLR